MRRRAGRSLPGNGHGVPGPRDPLGRWGSGTFGCGRAAQTRIAGSNRERRLFAVVGEAPEPVGRRAVRARWLVGARRAGLLGLRRVR
ncbi:hypothetical protein ACSHWB_21350 [Lentzea sp. HUAS TT2]|uniref:hypothetical protein n=1 Tax=Lentzea sp. HUAS TT2 TaxID=3447454 RepID=UPI003F707973